MNVFYFYVNYYPYQPSPSQSLASHVYRRTFRYLSRGEHTELCLTCVYNLCPLNRSTDSPHTHTHLHTHTHNTDIAGFPGHPSDPAAGADGTEIFQTSSFSTAQETFNYSCCGTNSSTSACVCTGCIFWPVKMVRVNGRTDLCVVCVCVCVRTVSLRQVGRCV